MMLDFPLPDDEAQKHSDCLHQLIIDRIDAAGGYVSFSDYMNWVLYEPGLGYYSGGATKLGKSGDFMTAPEMGTLFGKSLARAIMPLFYQTGYQILEVGAGTGRLAETLLAEWDALGVPLDRYYILDLSGELRQRQQKRLAVQKRIKWLNTLPEHFSGVVIANEVLDAMPVKLACLKQGIWYERCVTHQQGHLCFEDHLASPVFLSQLYTSLSSIDITTLPDNYVTEIHPYALGFIQSLAAMMKSNPSSVVLIDYGYSACEYYLPDRSEGTLICHYRHRVHDDCFFLPGLQDVTAHLNFTALAETARTSGLDVLCYATQAQFLTALGFMDVFSEQDSKGAKHAALVQEAITLLSSAEMGELFKVIVLGHGVMPTETMIQIDHSGRL